MKELAALCSAAAAKGLDWAQAAGGNASIKDEAADSLWLKASGLRLAEVSGESGWVRLKLSGARRLLADPALKSLPHGRQQDEAGKALLPLIQEGKGRPSLEAGFHALGGRACLHAHLVEALGPLCLEEGRAWFAETLASTGLNWAWVDYRPPGHSLALLVEEALKRQPGAELVLMKNHGPIAYAADGAGALGVLERLEAACAGRLGRLEPPAYEVQPRLFQDLGPALAMMVLPEAHWKVSHQPWVASLALDGEWTWAPLCPDDPIYAGLQVPCLEEAPDLEGLKRLFGPAPRQAALALKGLGVVLAAKDARSLAVLEEMLYANARARALARSQGALRPLTQGQCLEVLGMEGEKYRQGL